MFLLPFQDSKPYKNRVDNSFITQGKLGRLRLFWKYLEKSVNVGVESIKLQSGLIIQAIFF